MLDNFYQRLPFLGRYLRSGSRLRNFAFFNPEKRARIVEQVRKNLTVDISQLPSSSLLDGYTSSRFREANQFSEVKTPDGTALPEILRTKAGTPEATAVSDGIRDALAKAEPGTSDALSQFKEDIDALHTVLGKAPMTSGEVTKYLEERKTEVFTALDTEHEKAKTALTTQFADPAYKNHLKTTLSITDDQIDGIRDALIAETDKKHDEAKSEAGKKITESVEGINKKFARREKELAFIMSLQDASGRMDNAIRDIIEEKRKKSGAAPDPLTLSTTLKMGPVSIKDVKLGDLPFIALGTGLFDVGEGEKLEGVDASGNIIWEGGKEKLKLKRQITLNKDSSGNITGIEMEMPSGINYPYFWDPRENTRSDMRRFVATLCVLHENPRIDLSDATEEQLYRLGRAAYEALRLEGKQPEECNIYINGEKKSANDLFKGGSHKQQLQKIEAAAARMQAVRDEETKAQSKSVSTTHLRKEIAAVRAAATAPPAPAPGGPAPP